MSSFAWMRFLESAPQRYDSGIRALSRGRIGEVYQDIAERVAGPGRRVLDIGCGTGGVTLACAAKGAHVVGIDINAGMLEIARRKPVPEQGRVQWLQVGVAEVEDQFTVESFDAVVSCLAFSELSADERPYALRVALRLLVPGGHIVIADESEPNTWGRRAWHRLVRWPRSMLAYLLTQASTQPVRGLAAGLETAGFSKVDEARLWSDTFVIVEGLKPD